MLANVQQKTIQPIIEATVARNTLIYTDEYDIDARLGAWGYRHKAVCHGRGEYARDEDGDGFCEVHVNTLEGFWSLLRSAASRRRSCRSTSASSSSCITPAAAARPCSANLSPPWWHDAPTIQHQHPGSRKEPQRFDSDARSGGPPAWCVSSQLRPTRRRW